MSSPSESNTFTFAWDGRSNDFLGWLLPVLMVDAGPDKILHLSELTSRWQNVELGITINGEPVNATHFVESLQRNLTHLTEQAARDFLNEKLGLGDIVDDLVDFEKALRFRVRCKARDLGVDLGEEDD